MKTIFPSEMLNSSQEAMTLESIASKLTYFEVQLHLIHWQTSGYAEHMATGGLYNYVHDFKDGLLEKLMGYTGRKPAPFKLEPLTSTSANAVVAEMMLWASQLKSYGEMNGYHDICNLADDFSGTSAKTKYLLTLS